MPKLNSYEIALLVWEADAVTDLSGSSPAGPDAVSAPDKGKARDTILPAAPWSSRGPDIPDQGWLSRRPRNSVYSLSTVGLHHGGFQAVYPFLNVKSLKKGWCLTLPIKTT